MLGWPASKQAKTRQFLKAMFDAAPLRRGSSPRFCAGPRQAAAYEEDLIARCREIADGVAITQGCRQLIDPNLPEDLRFTRSGQHFIVFIEDAAQVIIVDFLHARSDLPGKIAALSSAKTQNNH